MLIGMFVSNNLCHHVIDACKLNCFDVEHLLVEIRNVLLDVYIGIQIAVRNNLLVSWTQWTLS